MATLLATKTATAYRIDPLTGIQIDAAPRTPALAVLEDVLVSLAVGEETAD